MVIEPIVSQGIHEVSRFTERRHLSLAFKHEYKKEMSTSVNISREKENC